MGTLTRATLYNRQPSRDHATERHLRSNPQELILRDPDKLPRLTFFTKYSLLKAVTGIIKGDNLISLLNSLRNCIAHILDRDKLKELTDKLRQAPLKSTTRPDLKSVSDRVLIRSAFIAETSRLRGAIDAFVTVTSADPALLRPNR